MGPPIFIGGKAADRHAVEQAIQASMGPPIFIGGKFNDRPIITYYSRLQWGHRFSSVESASTPASVLLYGRFNGATDFHRWKETYARVQTEDRGASMGPPIFIGGKRVQGGALVQYSRLQWGHRFSSVERRATRAPSSVARSLQWGHRFSSVESLVVFAVDAQERRASMGPPIFIGGKHQHRMRSNAGKGFNGATDFHRWKDARGSCLRRSRSARVAV